MATIDYMIAAYGPYSASATGGNALARDFLAGIAAMYSTPCKSSLLLVAAIQLTQCKSTATLARNTHSNGHRLFSAASQFSSPFPSTSSTGKGLRSVSAPNSPRRSLATERQKVEQEAARKRRLKSSELSPALRILVVMAPASERRRHGIFGRCK